MASIDFSEIRPYDDGEVGDVLERLLDDDAFVRLIGRMISPLFARITPWAIKLFVERGLRRQLGTVDTVGQFQDIVARYAVRLVRKTTTGFDYSGLEELEAGKPCLFVSNHRDIATDSMLVNYALYFSGRDTVRIAVGDNLIQKQFATDLMRLNKSFMIRRSVEGVKKIYAALLQSSAYIQESLGEGHSIWIAQSEGRAKDGFDRTDPAIIKMFLLAQRKDVRPLGELIEAMNIVPVTLSYEYDPCDQLKARELYYIDSDGHYTKPEGEDLISLAKGLGEFKGRVRLRFGTPLNSSFDSAEEVAAELDRQIMENYQLSPSNYIALSMIEEEEYRKVWREVRESGPATVTREKEREFNERLDECPEEFRPHFLRMYANPILNVRSVRAQNMASQQGASE